MSIEDLEYKEAHLRECFKEKLEHLDVNGQNDYSTVKCIKMYGVLWHLTHQLLKAEREDHAEHEVKHTVAETTAETMNIQTTGLKMTGSK